MSPVRLLIGGSHTHTHTFSLRVLIISVWLCCRSVSHHPALDSSSYQSSDLGECFLPPVGEQRRGRWRSRGGGGFLEFTCCLSVAAAAAAAGVSLQYFSHRQEILQTAAASLKVKRKKKKITYSLELWQHCFTHRLYFQSKIHIYF